MSKGALVPLAEAWVGHARAVVEMCYSWLAEVCEAVTRVSTPREASGRPSENSRNVLEMFDVRLRWYKFEGSDAADSTSKNKVKHNKIKKLLI